ncbi:MAG: Fe-S cluster assembly protein SufD [Ginsengibacter sp.]
MQNISTDYIGEKYKELEKSQAESALSEIRKSGFEQFKTAGIPGFKDEEWKYTFISNLFKKEYDLQAVNNIRQEDIDSMRLPGAENANELVFINGAYQPSLSTIRSSDAQLAILPLEEAATGSYKDIVKEHLDKSSLFINDGIHALNTSFMNGGVFIAANKNEVVEHPIYVYNITDTHGNHVLAQPRSLIYVEESAKVQVVETYKTFGAMDSFTNEVVEIVVMDNAIMEYYKIQNDSENSNHVGTTHIRQVGKCYVHTVTISLDGGVIRNNIDIIMEKAGNEGHMYGLYLLKGRTHVDNHTLVDNTMPNCFSNELYKGIIDDYANAVFSGKIIVRPDAQKTNAYQSNKNIVLSKNATVNTKPQLEIFADDVKCSHGCTIGQLDNEALYYLRTRGIAKEDAQAMLLNAFAEDIVSQIKIEPIHDYVTSLIVERLHVREEILA